MKLCGGKRSGSRSFCGELSLGDWLSCRIGSAMTVRPARLVSRVHFPRSLRQELFGLDQRPWVKLLVLLAALGALAPDQTGI